MPGSVALSLKVVLGVPLPSEHIYSLVTEPTLST